MTVHIVDDFRTSPEPWRSAGIDLPSFDPARIRARTASHPYWVHFGAGNLFRAVHAPIAQDLIESGATDSGVIVAETFDPEIIDRAYTPYLDRCLQIVLGGDGTTERRLIASVAASYGIRAHDASWEGLVSVFRDPQLQFATVTITEKGYAVYDADGRPLPWMVPEMESGPDHAASAMGIITALLWERYKAGASPIAMVSTDNFSQNGDRFFASVDAVATSWRDAGTVEPGFVDYVRNPATVSFPLSMIDRITPNPAASVGDRLAADGFADTEIIHTAKRTNVAPFANTERTWYLVIEDSFPNGRPDLTKAGVYLTDRDTVNAVDEMKVTACLNPLHTALATFGMLLGSPSMSAAIADPTLKALAERLGYVEGLPVVTDPGIIKPRDFLTTVIEERIPNPNIPDTPARISTDTSQKLPIRFGVTVGKYLSQGRDLDTLVAIPLVFAGWLRLLLGKNGVGTDDRGEHVALSPDPRMADLQRALSPLSLGGDLDGAADVLRPILADASIFGVDLNTTPLADRVIAYFTRFASGTGTVTPVIRHALGVDPEHA